MLHLASKIPQYTNRHELGQPLQEPASSVFDTKAQEWNGEIIASEFSLTDPADVQITSVRFVLIV